MSEAGDYSPGVWAGHDFASARRNYRDFAATSMDKALSRGTTVKDLVPASISTESENPMAIVTDQSGSMGEWPATMFSKMPYLEHEAKTEYMGTDVEISWGAIGDARNNEKYPLQMRPFAKGTDHAQRLKELVIEGEGGGTTQESYELAALYCARNVVMPNAVRPLLIVIGDESPYDFVDPEEAELIARVKLPQKVRTSQIFDELKQKFSVYFIQKPYGREVLSDGPLTGTTKRVHENWAALVGEDHIALLADPGRVVDVIFGIMAREAGKIGYFRKELSGRQTPEQVKTVMTSLHTIHALPSGEQSKKSLGEGRSVTIRKN
ncbi:MAG: hypothetical protein HYW89_04485 [Candidatus Sungiibacteriota bacterium]|uniref:VWA domain-containing protein n=1 Tax=Candidatus Sungiibacteriota bacterium TaxID=2750080 RepID=A0A7T5RJF9_9BACT|nr:MAG: hypothetical protein HYW89_04485 [Candidatus Sungbacteria bacterium]